MKTRGNFSVMSAGFRTLIFVASMLIFATCLNDKTEDFSSYIRFEVYENDGFYMQGKSRSIPKNTGMPADANVILPRLYILHGENSADTLFIHATVTDGIKSSIISEEKSVTRNKSVEAPIFNNSFGVMTFVYSGQWNEATLKPDYMYNVEVTKSSNWTTKYHWPGGGSKVRIFAYSPYNGKGITLSPIEHTGRPQITYTVPDDVTGQNNLLVSVKEMPSNASINMTVQLIFQHILTAVKFETENAALAGKIKQITLKNIYGKGIYTMDTGWSNQTDIKNFEQNSDSVNINNQTENIYCKPGSPITNSITTFMMVPQKLPSKAQIEIKYTDDANIERTLTTAISGEWLAGKTVTYRISATGIHANPFIEVNGLGDFTYQGGKSTYTVTSYATIPVYNGFNVDTVSMPWTAEYIDDAGNPISQEWLNLTLTGNSSNETTHYSESYTATAAPQTGVYSNQHNITLQNATSLGSVNDPYNLSNSIGALEIENTANCYLVNAPGYYKLPLVYGNAIKDGNPNESAYTSDKTGTNVLQTFVNHLDVPISKPFIYDNQDCVPSSAVLVWQDEKNLVTNVDLSTDKHFLTFEVPPANIKQGNAVVAVKDGSGIIMWSWHIWVTDYKLGTELKTITDPANLTRNYSFLPYNLGWCDANTTTYSERSVKIRFTQTCTKKSCIITITQKSHSVSIGANNPYYQWGRKDPMLSSDGTNKNKIWYDTYGLARRDTINASWAVDSTVISNGIKNPKTFCTNIAMDNKYINLWNIDNNSVSEDLKTSVKSVYDPCPTGYKIPVANAFRTFTAVNSAWKKYPSNIWGRDFTCNIGSLLFPASGYRNYYDSKIYDKRGNYWSASSNNSKYGCYFTFDKDKVHLKHNANRTCGNAVRPVKDE